MMDLLEDALPWLCMAAVCATMIATLYGVCRRIAARGERRRRIAAARVRSGHVPLEIPTLPGALEPSAHDVDDGLVVDERPRLHLSYVDGRGRLAQRVVQVEQLDLFRNVILYPGDIEGDVRTVPLNRIRVVSNAHTGQSFELGTWVDAVRAARRRRDLNGAFESRATA